MRSKLILVFTVVFAFVMLTANAGLAEASTSRVAIISTLKGTVEVQKSGGKRTLKGFKNMSLNEGDIVSTGSKSSVELKFSNGTSTDDTLVLESDTTVTFSKLSNRNGTVTKVKMKSGKAWVDVKSIATSSDDFQLETPTAIMGVRGTNFFIGIDPNTGKSVLSMFSGVVSKLDEEDNFNRPTHIYPSQISYYNPEEGTFTGAMSNQSIEQLLQNTSPETMEAILANLKKIQEENERLLESLKNGTVPANPGIIDNEQMKQNIERLTSALLAAAQEKGLLSQEEVRKKQLELFGDSTNVPDSQLETDERNNQYDFILNQKTQQMLEQLNKQNLVEEKKREMEQKLAEQKRKLEEEKKKREQEALDKLLQSMNDSQRDRLLEQRERIEQERNPQRPTPVPSRVPVPTPAPTPSGWNAIAEPLKLTHYNSNTEEQLSYNRVSGTVLSLSDVLSVGESSLRFEAANDNMSISSLIINNEELYGDEGIYMWYVPADMEEFTATITINHTVYGNRTFTLNGSLHYEAPIVDAESPIIEMSTESLMLQVGDELSLQVFATVFDGGTISYQWYRSTSDSRSDGIAISGATSSNYMLPTNEAGTSYYYVVVTNTNEFVNGETIASATSDVVQVVVNPIIHSETPEIITLTDSLDVYVGDEYASLSVEASVSDGGQLSYQWYRTSSDDPAQGQPIIDETSPVMSVPTNQTGVFYYYVVVTNNSGSTSASAISPIVRVEVMDPSEGWNTVTNPFVITQQGYGDPVELSYIAVDSANYVFEEDTIYLETIEDMLAVRSSSADITILSVKIGDNEESLPSQNGVYRGSMPYGEFTLTIRMNHEQFGEKQFTVNGYAMLQQQGPDWEELGFPFNVAHYDGSMVEINLNFQPGEDLFSYKLNGRIVVSSEEELLRIESRNSEVAIVGARINGDSLQQVEQGFTVPLSMGWDRSIIEIDVEHRLYPEIGIATYVLTIDTRSDELGWESIERPFEMYLVPIEELFTEQDPESDPESNPGPNLEERKLTYTHSARDYYSLALSDSLYLERERLAEGEEESNFGMKSLLVISMPMGENGQPIEELDYYISGVTINNQGIEFQEQLIFIPIYYGEYALDVEVLLTNDEYEDARFNMQVEVASEELFSPVQLWIGDEQVSDHVALESYEPLNYISYMPPPPIEEGEVVEEEVIGISISSADPYSEDVKYVYLLPKYREQQIEYLRVLIDGEWNNVASDENGGFNFELSIDSYKNYRLKLTGSDQVYEITIEDDIINFFRSGIYIPL